MVRARVKAVQGRGGFTLIELLVVIAVIAILAALLLPVYLTGKQQSITAKCQIHQKKLMAALLMYTDDYGGRLPFIQFLTYTDWGGQAAGRPDLRVVRLYEPYVKNFDIILCPALMAYAYNQCLYTPLPKTLQRYGGIAEISYDSSPKKRSGRLLLDIPKPGRTPAFFCAKRMAGKNDQRATPGDVPDNGWGWVPSDITVADYLPNRHNGGANYAFLDGHCRWYRPAGYPFCMPIEGIDYDGSGSVGSDKIMR